jgi:hypothetical protein
MKVFDTVNIRIERIGDSVGIYFPIEYDAMEGFDAEFSAGLEGNDIVFKVKPYLKKAVEETVDEMWKDLRTLFSGIGDIGEKAPWEVMDIMWIAEETSKGKVPISASEVVTHRHSKATYGEEYVRADREDMRKGIHDTITKLCELAALRLGFKNEVYARAFGQAVGNNYSFTSCLYGTYDILCEIFKEEFMKVDDDRNWGLTSEPARKAVKAAYDRIKFLEEHPEEYKKEEERVRNAWQPALKTA